MSPECNGDGAADAEREVEHAVESSDYTLEPPHSPVDVDVVATDGDQVSAE